MAIFIIIQLSGSSIKFTRQELIIASKILAMLYHCLTFLFYVAMTFISADRLLGTAWPLKYNCYMRVSTVRRIVCSMWLVSIVASLPFPFIFNSVVHHTIILYVSYTMQSIFVLVTVATYTTIYVKMKRRSLRFTTVDKQRFNKAKHLVPFFILLSFVLFYQIPNFMSPRTKDMKALRAAVTCLGLSIDPIIYIFLNKALRRHVIDMLIQRNCMSSKEERSDSSTIVSNVRGHANSDASLKESKETFL